MSKKLGLSLSGGGYRAAAFHLGTLKKLNELKVLSKVNVISTVSGGSITGAYYCLNNTTKTYEEIEAHMIKTLNTKSVIRFVIFSWTFLKPVLLVLSFLSLSILLLFTPFFLLSPLVIILLFVTILLWQYKIFPVSKRIEKAYNKFFYDDATLSQLNDQPELAINATNLQTARPFTFSKRKMEDSLYANLEPKIKFKNSNFPVATAVMASSCVPFAFTPVTIANEFYEDPTLIPKYIPQLVDGGVYDNQGIHKITQGNSSYACDIIITSDAGNKIPFENVYRNVFTLLIRTMDVFMARIKHFQMIQNLYQNTDFANKEITYLSLGWDISGCIPGFIDNMKEKKIIPEVIGAHNIPNEWLNDIDKFRQQIQKHLETKTGYEKLKDLPGGIETS